jgi:hypothetical protein
MDSATNQRWRAPLRKGLESLSAKLTTIIARDWPAGAGGLHGAPPGHPGAEASPVVRRLRELERHRLAMFTSCAWFFDDLARIEPRIVLRHAARALDLLASPEESSVLERALVSTLAEARANDSSDGNGADIWQQDVLPGRLAVPRLAAGLIALQVFERELPITFTIPSHSWIVEGNYVHLTDLRTGEETRWIGEVISLGVVANRVHLRPAWGGASLVVEAIDFPEAIRTRIATIAAAFVFDATLGEAQRRALDSGLLDPVSARRAALEGALEILYPADAELVAAPLLHGVLDLWALAGESLSLEERALVWQHLAPLPHSIARTRLAERLELSF